MLKITSPASTSSLSEDLDYSRKELIVNRHNSSVLLSPALSNSSSSNNRRKLFSSIDENMEIPPLEVDIGYNEEKQNQAMKKFKDKFSIHCKNVKKSFMKIFPAIDICEQKCLNANQLGQNDALELTKGLQTILKGVENEISENFKEIDKTYQSWSRNYSSHLRATRKFKNYGENDNFISETETNTRVEEKVIENTYHLKKTTISKVMKICSTSESDSDEISENGRKSSWKRFKNSSRKRESKGSKLEQKKIEASTLKTNNFSSTFEIIKKSLGVINSVFGIFENQYMETFSDEAESIEEKNSPENQNKQQVNRKSDLNYCNLDSEKQEENNSCSGVKLKLSQLDFDEEQRSKESKKEETVSKDKNIEMEINKQTESKKKFQKLMETASKIQKLEESNKDASKSETEVKLKKKGRKRLASGKNNFIPTSYSLSWNNNSKKKKRSSEFYEPGGKKFLKLSKHSDNNANEKLRMTSYVKLEILDEKLLNNHLRAEEIRPLC